jgi:hypothetical protein
VTKITEIHTMLYYSRRLQLTMPNKQAAKAPT